MNLRETKIVSYQHKQKLPNGTTYKGGHHEHMRTWSPEEQRLAHELRQRLGTSSWKHIAQLLTKAGYDRSAASVRNYFLRKKPERKYPTKSRFNKCSLCGQVKRFHVCTAVTAVRQEDLPHAPPKQVLRDSTSVRPEDLQGQPLQTSDRVVWLTAGDSPPQTTLTLATSLAEAQAMQPPESADPIQEPASATYVARPPRPRPPAAAAPCEPPPELRFQAHAPAALPEFVHAGTSAFSIVRPVA